MSFRSFILFIAMTFMGHSHASSICIDSLKDEAINNLITDSIASSWNIPEGSLAYQFIQLQVSGQLISQSDPALGKRGLLVPGGGLCNSSCIAGIALAVVQKMPLYKKQLDSHEVQIAQAVERLSIIQKSDARMGSFPFDISNYFKALQAEGSLPENVKTEMDYEKSIETFSLQSGEIALSTISQPAKGPHSVIILSINPATRSLLLFDPNHAKRLIEMNYQLSDQNNFNPIFNNTNFEPVELLMHGRSQGQITEMNRVQFKSIINLPVNVAEKLSH